MISRWSVLVMASLFSLNAMADDYSCPESLEVKQVLVSSPTDDWSGMYESTSGDVTWLDDQNAKETTDTVKLVEIALYAGDPKDGSMLDPDNEEELAEKEADTIWTLPSAEEQQKTPVYVACHYEGSGVGVFKKITAPVKSCKWPFNADSVNNVLTCAAY